jgi:hypothetical protein
MLPLTLQFLIAMIASAINERLQRRLDYALEEVRVLKEILRAATGKDRISFTPDQRRCLALAGIELTPRNVGPTNDNGADGKVACRSRLGGLLSYYHREAA